MEGPVHENLFAAPPERTPTPPHPGATDAFALRSRHLVHEGRLRDVGSLIFAVFGGGAACMAVSAVLLVLVLVTTSTEAEAEVIFLSAALAGYIGAFAGFCVVLAMVGRAATALQRRWTVGFSLGGLALLMIMPVGTVLGGRLLWAVHCDEGKIVLGEDYEAAVAATPELRPLTPGWVWALLGITWTLVGLYCVPMGLLAILVASGVGV